MGAEINRKQTVLFEQFTQGIQILLADKQLAADFQSRSTGSSNDGHQMRMTKPAHQVGAIGRCGDQYRGHLMAPAPMNCLASGVCGLEKNASDGPVSHTLP